MCIRDRDYGDRLQWQTDDYKWDMVGDPADIAVTDDLTGNTTVAALQTAVNTLADSLETNISAALVGASRRQFTCYTIGGGSDGSIVELAVGLGRL